jgi:hypothetical protein
MGIEEGEEVQAKGIHNMFNKIIMEISPDLKEDLPIKVEEASRTQNRLEQNRTSLCHIIIKITSKDNKVRILKATRKKKQETYKGKPIKIADFSMETLKSRRAWSELFQALNDNNFSPRLLYPEKLLFKIDRGIKVFHDTQKLKQYMTTKPQKIL